MAYEQTGDILKKLQNVHEQLAACYGRYENTHKGPRVQLLLQYLKDHELKLKSGMEEYEKVMGGSTLKTFHSKSPDKEAWETFAACNISQEIDFEALVKEVLETDDAYIRILEEIHSYSDTEKQRELFKNLIDEARQSRNRFVYNVMMLGDA